MLSADLSTIATEATVEAAPAKEEAFSDGRR